MTPELVPLFDLRLTPQDIGAVEAVLRSGEIAMGERTRRFERAIAERLEARHVVALASGTAALHLAYLLAGVGRGDEVIVPSFTFTATASAVRYCGATPVFADIVGLDDLTLDVADVERRITPKTTAVTCVHFAGYAAAADRLAALCAERGLTLIEDAAHAPVAELHGRALGTWGRLGVFSLFSNKVLSVGEGGLLVTDEDELAERAWQLRGERFGEGFEYRFDDLHAALALSRLAGLDRDVERRRAATHAYRAGLAHNSHVTVPFPSAAVASSSCYAMPILLREPGRRDQLQERLLARHGVQTSVLYEPVHLFTAFRSGTKAASLPNSEAASARVLALPLFGHITEAQREQVLAAVEQECAR